MQALDDLLELRTELVKKESALKISLLIQSHAGLLGKQVQDESIRVNKQHIKVLKKQIKKIIVDI